MANYPTSISTNSNLYVAVNGLQTTLALAINASVTTITLTSTSGFPTTGLVTINNLEVVSYTGISGSDLTGCTRGADGTTAASHNAGVTVGLTVVAAHHNLLKDEVIAIETALGANLANVQPAGNYITALTGDVTATGPGSVAATLATVNGNVGSFTLANFTVNAKGLITAASTTASTGSGNVVLATSPTLVTPNLGTPSAVNLANATNLPNSATTATPNATANTIVSRDASVNTKVNELIENFSTTVTAAGTTTLTVTSSPLQQFTGTTTQTVTLPDATTLTTGHYFTVLNRSTGAVTVNKNGGALQVVVAASAQSTFVCTSTASAAGVWDTSTSSGGSATAYREDYVVGTALSNYTGSLTVFDLVTPYSVGGNSLIVTLDGDVQTKGATVDYQETDSDTVTFVNTLVSGQKVSFIFQTATSSGGTVNSGTSGQVAYYPATGPTVSGTDAFAVGSTGPNGIITGTNTNNSAAAGKVGEYISSVVGITALPATDTYGDLASISLTAGDWDMSANGVSDGNAAGGYTRSDLGVSTTSGNSTTGLVMGDTLMASNSPPANHCQLCLSGIRISLASTTTVYLKMRATFTSGSPTFRGARLSARRIR